MTMTGCLNNIWRSANGDIHLQFVCFQATFEKKHFVVEGKLSRKSPAEKPYFSTGHHGSYSVGASSPN